VKIKCTWNLMEHDSAIFRFRFQIGIVIFSPDSQCLEVCQWQKVGVVS
jgi:hypothetical protein